MPSETAIQTLVNSVGNKENSNVENPSLSDDNSCETNEQTKVETNMCLNLKRALDNKSLEVGNSKKVKLTCNSNDSKSIDEIILNDDSNESTDNLDNSTNNLCQTASIEEINSIKTSDVSNENSINGVLNSICNNNDFNNTLDSNIKIDCQNSNQSDSDVTDSINNHNCSIINDKKKQSEGNESCMQNKSKLPSTNTKNVNNKNKHIDNNETIECKHSEKNKLSNTKDNLDCIEEPETRDSDVEMIEEIIYEQNENNDPKPSKINEKESISKIPSLNSVDKNKKKNTASNCNVAEKEVSNNTNVLDNDCEVILESDMESDQSDDSNTIESVIKGNTKLSKENFPALLKFFSRKKLTFEQFESLCSQKIAENITEKNKMGKERSEIHLLMQREKIWRMKYESLAKQVKELRTIINKHKADLRVNENAKPHIITRTVGLQAILCPKECLRLPKRLMPLQVNNKNGDNIIDDDVIALTDTSTATSSTQIILKPSPVKVLNSSIKVKSTQVLVAKDVPPSLPLNCTNNNASTIDLTDNDDVNDVSNNLAVQQQISPVKILRRSGVNKVVLPSSPTGNINRNSSQVVPKTVAYIGIPTSTNFIVKTTAASGTQLTSVKKLTTTNPNSPKSVRPFLLKNGKMIPLQISSVNSRQLPPTAVPLSTCKIQQSKVNQIQIQVPTTLSEVSIKHPAPLPEVPNQRHLPSWKKLPPSPKLNITKTPENQTPKGLVLSWNLIINKAHAEITNYQIYAYQETTEPPKEDLWKKIGEVNALPLPMACSLTQFMQGQKYHFAVRAVDVYTRVGPFSAPQSVHLT
ncbi:activating transcription factor 7-interacting protein 2-like [Daktulosphaira vitifoliae]|uniref:activating transcription factor 7-interacting protein 2-like n=1 Tax=Daktulosphaira vitifoliae TaxID=58002 RepID=UPI0021A9F1FB|nr:activating transcription factor 7-interacting protein 2-like [Daktulosphaira vitifoliae]XP_050533791.1 activating transcription factor 7-interacting protein 2-like [Daktulosphaira vitifoliae]